MNYDKEKLFLKETIMFCIKDYSQISGIFLDVVDMKKVGSLDKGYKKYFIKVETYLTENKGDFTFYLEYIKGYDKEIDFTYSKLRLAEPLVIVGLCDTKITDIYYEDNNGWKFSLCDVHLMGDIYYKVLDYDKELEEERLDWK